MKASTYPVLRNRPIDQWKVTELRDELKRRKLVTKGLKEELVKRLGEALRNERESSDQEEDENGNDEVSQIEDQDDAIETTPVAAKSDSEVAEVDEGVDILVKDAEDQTGGENIEVDDVSGLAVKDDNVEISDKNVGQQSGELTPASPAMKDESVTDEKPVEISNAASEKTSTEAALASGQGSEDEQAEKNAEVDPILGQDFKDDVEISNAASENTSTEAALAGGQGSEDEQAEKNAEVDPMLGQDFKDDVEISNTASENTSTEAALAGGQVSEDEQAGNNVEVDISDKKLVLEAVELTYASPSAMKDESVTDEQSVEMSNAASENMSSEAVLAGQGSVNEQTDNKNSDSRTQLDAEDIKPLDEQVKHNMSDLNSQVSEVSPSLGIRMKNVSVSTDSISINEKNELKDNIIADDVKLEPDVKHETVKPSSSPLVPDGGESRPMDVEEPQIEVSVDETLKTVNVEDMSKKNSSADLGSPEKLNLDRSSGDDSMEEDTLEIKQVDSAYKPHEVEGRVEKTDVSILKEETTIDALGDDISSVRKDGHVDDMAATAASTEKRKLPDNQKAPANNEPSKRQRRWKTESVMAAESVKLSVPQSSGPAMSTTPRGTPQALDLKRSFSRSNSNADDDSPKERVVPPPVKPPTDSLRIDNFLRPFTLKAVQELLGKNGTVTSFWMDHIKTHCYVTYSSVEEAMETRNAVYNLKWPSNGGRLLIAEFVDAQEVKSHMEAPPQLPSPVAPVNVPQAAPVAPLQPSPRQLAPRQKQLLQTNLPPPPPLGNPPPARERLQPPPPPPLEKVDPPVVTLDDLFRKTKTTPRIYYLPLSEELVKAKLEAQRRSSKQ